MGHLEFPDVGSKVSSEFLGRTKITVEGAIITKPHERHAQTILKALGLEDCKPSPVPGKKLDLKQDQELSAAERETYASCVGSAIYLSQDRSDIKFAVKELAKRVRNPRLCDWQNLETLGRYLKGTLECGHTTTLASGVDRHHPVPVHAYCDSDWAGDEESRKSTSGEVLVLGGTVIETGSHTQQGTPATSSAEAEIRSLTHCAQSAVHVKNLCEQDLGMEVEMPRIWCDSSAALQAAKKLGAGKMRHLAVGHLYIQELVKEKQVVIAKVDGKQNPADALTKHLVTGEDLRIARERLGIVDLTQAGLDKHVSKHGMTSVSTVNAQTDNTPDACEPWKPLMGSKLSLRADHSSVQRNKRVTPYVKDGGGTQCCG